MALALDIPSLRGNVVHLEPMTLDSVSALVEAANEDRRTYGFTRVPSTQAAMTEYVEELLHLWSLGEAVPFVQVAAHSGRIVGATRFLTLRRTSPESIPFAVEIGGTWLGASAQRSGINVEAKFLLMEYAFSRWSVGRVDIKTDARNERTRTAILALGASFEGVLGHWQPSLAPGEEGLLRDSAMYCVTDEAWPQVRERLLSRLAAYGTPPPGM